MYSTELIVGSQVQLSAGAALISHFFFVQRDPNPWLVIAIYAFIWFLLPAYLISFQNEPIKNAIYSSTIIAFTYTGVLLTSIGFYRIFLHRLRHYPGPLSLKLSKWFSVSMDAQGLRPREMTRLHEKYGDIIRVGPRELSINDPNAVSSILGGKSNMRKGPWYLAAHGGKGARVLSLHVTIDPASRRARRRIWDQAFSVKALSTYEEDLKKFTNEIMEKLEAKAKEEKSLEVDQWCMFFSFDIMGQLGFSKSFNMMRKGKFSNEISLLEGFMSAVMVLGNIPYVSEVARLLPNPLQMFDDYTEKAVDERIELEKTSSTQRPDIFTYLLNEDQETGWKHTQKELQADAGLIIVAGSDTSSSTLSLALFNLASKPECFALLRKEIKQVFPGLAAENIEDFDALSKQCPYLNAVINETLRLYPPVASGVQREVPSTSQGETVQLRGGKSVILPPGTAVSIPTTLIQRDPRNFSPLPNEFRPERWIEKEKEKAFNPAAFIPFGYGPSGCIGKQLAYMEIRSFLAQFVVRFDISLAPEFNSAEFIDGIRDTFTMTRHKHLLVRLRLNKD